MIDRRPRKGETLLYDDGDTREHLKVVDTAMGKFHRNLIVVEYENGRVLPIRAGKPGDWNPNLTNLGRR